MVDCPRPIQTCEAVVVTEATRKKCQPWECCLPWGAKLVFDGKCLEYHEGTPPADGTYGTVTVVDGCIRDVGDIELPVYRGDPCAAVPCPCDSSEDGESNLCNPSTTSGNLYSCDMTGKPLVKAYITSGSENVTITGQGTSTNPFVITVTVDAGLTNVGTNTGSVISVSKDGTVAYVDHKEVYGQAGTINGMMFDKYGHLSSVDTSSASSSVTAVVGTNGVSASTDQTSGIVTVELADPAYDLSGQKQFGGYEVTFDGKNMVFNAEQNIDIGAAAHHWGTQSVSHNTYGSLTGITEVNSLGTFIGAYLEPPADTTILQRTITFTLYHDVPVVVEVMGVNTQTWAEAMIIRLDGSRIGDVFVGAGTSKGTFVVRAVASGVWKAGEHTLKISNASGFDTESGMFVAVIPFQSATYTDDETIG